MSLGLERCLGDATLGQSTILRTAFGRRISEPPAARNGPLGDPPLRAYPLVYRLLNPLGFVAFKMGRLRGARKEHPAPFYAPADLVLSRRCQNGAGRD